MTYPGISQSRAGRFARSLLQSTRGISLIEFALLFPFTLTLGLGGMEYINFVLARQKVERITASVSDIVARNTIPPNEAQINDVFDSVDDMGKPFKVSDNGRTIITGVIGVSLPAGGTANKVAWQRCSGALASETSQIGTAWTATSDFSDGPNVVLPNSIVLLQNQMAVVAEVAYRYEKMIPTSVTSEMPINGVFRERSIYVTRAQAFPTITPIPGVTRRLC